MTAKIIKLDEYLEKHRWSMARSVARVLGMNPDDDNNARIADQMIAHAVEKKFGGDTHELQTNLVAALEAEDDQAVKDLLTVEEWTTETFNGVDIAEGYNFRYHVTNEVAKNRMMDWLEEQGYDYLIDLDGRFAVRCPDRKSEYRVSRQFEHTMNKWDRGPVRKAVDPDPVRKGLATLKKDNALVDGLDEIAATQPTYTPGTGKDAEPGQGNPMFPSKKKKRHNHLDWDDPKLRESLEEGKKKKKKKKPDEQELSKIAAGGEGGDPAKDLADPQFQPKVIPDKKKEADKKKGREKVKVDESKLDEQVLGMLGMPTIGRMKELAGVSDSPNHTTVIEKPAGMDHTTIEVKVDEPKCEEVSGIDLAMEKLKDTFEVYKVLDCEQKDVFRKNLIDCLMRDK